MESSQLLPRKGRKIKLKEFEVNYGFLTIYSITVVLGNITLGYAMSCNN